MDFLNSLVNILGNTTVNSTITAVNTVLPFLQQIFKSKQDLQKIMIKSFEKSITNQIKLTSNTEIKKLLSDSLEIVKKEPDIILDVLEVETNFEKLITNDEILLNIGNHVAERVGSIENADFIGKQIGQALVNFYFEVCLQSLNANQKELLTTKTILEISEAQNKLESTIFIAYHEYQNDNKRINDKLDKIILLEKTRSSETNGISTNLNEELTEWSKNDFHTLKNDQLYDEKFTLEDIYIPLQAYKYQLKGMFLDLSDLERKYNNKTLDIHTEISNLPPNGKPILIFGSPGMGKSTFTKWLGLKISENRKEVIPVRIELKNFDFNDSFVDSLINYLNQFVSTNIHQSVFSKLNIQLILDGLDELTLNTFEEHEKFIKSLTVFARNYKNIKVILSSRVSVLNEKICDLLTDSYILHIAPFNQTQINRWIENWKSFNPEINLPILRLEQDFFTQPLMLYLFFRLVKENPSSIDINQKKVDIYSTLIDWTCGNEKFFTKDQLNLLTNYNITNKLLYIILKEFNENISLSMLTNGKNTIKIEDVLIKRLLPESIKPELLNKIDKDEEIAQQKLSAILLTQTNTTFIQSFELIDRFYEFEFVHKTFKEFLASKAIIRTLLEIPFFDKTEKITTIYKLFSTLKIVDGVEEFLFQLIDKINKEELSKIYDSLIEFFHEDFYSHNFLDSLDLSNYGEIKKYFGDYKYASVRKMQCNVGECLISILSYLNRLLSFDFDITSDEDELYDLISIANSAHYAFRFKSYGPINLQGIWLQRVSLTDANFNNCDMEDALLDYSCFSSSSFEDATLANASLNCCDLSNCKMMGADLYEAKMIGSTIVDADLTNCILERAELINSDFEGATFEGADLLNCQLNNSNLKGSLLVNCKLDNADLSNCDLERARIDVKTYNEYKHILIKGNNFDYMDIIRDEE